MKGGKDEKSTGPLFPRLHVNDKEKGGPRAPPRNKMALYEQLSIPSQRFNPSCVNSQVSSSEVHDRSESLRFAGFPSHSTSSSGTQKLPVARINRVSPFSSPSQPEKKRKLLDKDDFIVPVFVEPDANQVSTNPVCSVKENSKSPSIDPKVSTVLKRGCLDTFGNAPLKVAINYQEKSLIVQSSFDICADNSANLKFSDGSFKKSQNSGLHMSDTGEASENSSHLNNDLMPIEFQNNVTGKGNSNISKNDRILRRKEDLYHEISDASTSDSVSISDLTPDDVEKLIGQKLFWKARKVISNQQRVFAAQLFELHRLIKVQQLIAGYPDVLLEKTIDEPSMTSLLQDHSINETSAKCKKPTSDHLVAPPSFVTFTTDSENLKEKTECSPTANGSTKASSFLRRGSGNEAVNPEPSHRPKQTAENQAPSMFPPDPSLHPFPFPHPIGHQWLVPVMSPSEGLVYKPYPYPGFVGSVCGGCGHHGASSHRHNYGMLPCVPPYASFPPFGLPSTSGSVVDQTGQITENGSNDVSSRRSGTHPQAVRLPRSKDTHVQGSTASSSCQGEINVVSVDGVADVHGDSKVIKVVPRNRSSATESAVRIFQSIQEERKRNDSM